MKKLLAIGLLLILSACSSKSGTRFVMLEKTAVDQSSGVVWLKNANLPGVPLPWKADENVYAFIQKLNKENYAGYADWRVPSKKEMESMIDYAKSLGYDSNNMETWPYQNLRKLGFQGVRDYGYWTIDRDSPNEIWIADMASGKIVSRADTKSYCLWPVRGGHDQ